MALDFSDLIPAKPQGGLSFDDLIPKQEAKAVTEPISVPLWTERGMVDTPDANVVAQERVPPVLSPAIDRIAGAAGKAWEETKSVGIPALDRSPLGQQIVNPALKIAGGVVPGPWNPNLNAGMAALSQAAMEVFGEKGGRDALALLSSFPMINGERLSPKVAEKAAPAETPKFASERYAPSTVKLDPENPYGQAPFSELDPRHAISELIQHDIRENPPPAPGRGMANQGVDVPRATVPDIMNAGDIDGAIAAARGVARAALTPEQIRIRTPVRDRAKLDQGLEAPSEVLPTVEELGGTRAVGAAASREGTPPGMIETPLNEAADIRFQGEVERFATPPRQNDTTIYIPDTRLTLAEGTGDPRAAMDLAYNRQQPEALLRHTQQENHNADQIAAYYADTGGSRPTLGRMERARDERAEQNKKAAFGDNDAVRPTADPTSVVELMEGILNSPEGQERNVIRRTMPDLIDRFYHEDGTLKTDPLSLYGIRKHIGDLLDGAGDPESSSSARVIRKELMQTREKLDAVIQEAIQEFEKFRSEYARDSGEIEAMKLLQDERLALLNKDLHITPAKFFSFMKRIIEGRADPMDPAYSLSEAQMDRLWNITEHLKRQTFNDAGKPRGSWTSMMQEYGKRFAEVAAHVAVLPFAPVIGNVGIQMAKDHLRARSVQKEMNRLLTPDFGQQGP